VVEVEPAQEVLVGLAPARVLRGDEPRGRLEQFGRAEQRADFDVGACHAAFARRRCFADPLLATSVDVDRLPLRLGSAHILVVGIRRGRRHRAQQQTKCTRTGQGQAARGHPHRVSPSLKERARPVRSAGRAQKGVR